MDGICVGGGGRPVVVLEHFRDCRAALGSDVTAALENISMEAVARRSRGVGGGGHGFVA